MNIYSLKMAPNAYLNKLKLLYYNLNCLEISAIHCTFRNNLVDSASSHTLVSKIKPCMSKYKSFTLKLRMAHYISYSLFDSPLLLG